MSDNVEEDVKKVLADADLEQGDPTGSLANAMIKALVACYENENADDMHKVLSHARCYLRLIREQQSDESISPRGKMRREYLEKMVNAWVN